MGQPMLFTTRELWTMFHGMGLGAIVLLASITVVTGLWVLGHTWDWESETGIHELLRWLRVATGIMALAAWLTAFTGTFIVLPWYRATPPDGANLSGFPQAYLLADPSLAAWHTHASTWMQHIGWLPAVLSTAVACIVISDGTNLGKHHEIRRALLALVTVALGIAAVAGLLGALVTKVAPLR